MHLNKRRQPNATNILASLAPIISAVAWATRARSCAAVPQRVCMSNWSGQGRKADDTGRQRMAWAQSGLNIAEQRVLVLVSLHFYAQPGL